MLFLDLITKKAMVSFRRCALDLLLLAWRSLRPRSRPAEVEGAEAAREQAAPVQEPEEQPSRSMASNVSLSVCHDAVPPLRAPRGVRRLLAVALAGAPL